MVVLGVILYIHDRIMGKRDGAAGDEAPPPPQDTCSDTCCGNHEVCPSEMLLRHACDPVEYFDDEELDGFKGRSADDYSCDELEQWRDVLYTLQPSDLMPWQRSIKKRGIVMPDVIKDELISLINA